MEVRNLSTRVGAVAVSRTGLWPRSVNQLWRAVHAHLGCRHLAFARPFQITSLQGVATDELNWLRARLPVARCRERGASLRTFRVWLREGTASKEVDAVALAGAATGAQLLVRIGARRPARIGARPLAMIGARPLALTGARPLAMVGASQQIMTGARSRRRRARMLQQC